MLLLSSNKHVSKWDGGIGAEGGAGPNDLALYLATTKYALQLKLNTWEKPIKSLRTISKMYCILLILTKFD